MIKLINFILSRIRYIVDLEDKNGNSISQRNVLAKLNIRQNIIYQPDHSYVLSDPRIIFIKRIIQIMLVQIALNRSRAKLPFAFKLRVLKDWLIKTSPDAFLAQFSWHCNADCVFCYQKGTPSFIKTKRKNSFQEMETRLKYFNPQESLGLVAGETYENDEILTNPNIIKGLKSLREKGCSKILEILTNGTPLTHEMIDKLACFHPLKISISLNSADINRRKQLMNDSRPGTAIASLPLLKQHKIPFTVNIVAWPGLPLSDIKKTIRYAERNDAYAVKICAPGFSKYFSNKQLFKTKELWRRLAKWINVYRKNLSVPLYFSPNLFVENLPGSGYLTKPYILGVVKNSPAYQAGLKTGDILLEIDKISINNREEALANLLKKESVSIKIMRGGKILSFLIKYGKHKYPYLPFMKQAYGDMIDPFGIMLPQGLKTDDVLDVYRYSAVYKAKNVLLITSRMVRPTLRLLIKQHYNGRINVFLLVPKNRFFGGSIIMGDLLVVNDFIFAIRSWLRKHKKRPDLILIPNSPFSAWGRDLIGDNKLKIEREIGIPVEFIYNSPIFRWNLHDYAPAQPQLMPDHFHIHFYLV
ncbi:MAG: radical SAM protein [Candidatus Margulisiibacteriota bacterium]